jgi:hypothetical protein
MKSRDLITLKEIEGTDRSHDGFVKATSRLKKDALKFIDDIAKSAEYLGAEVETLGIGEDWAIKKEIFPGVEIHLVYQHGDEEVPPSLRTLYSGDKVRIVGGEDLANLAISLINHLLRYIRETAGDKKLPEVCYRV